MFDRDTNDESFLKSKFDPISSNTPIALVMATPTNYKKVDTQPKGTNKQSPGRPSPKSNAKKNKTKDFKTMSLGRSMYNSNAQVIVKSGKSISLTEGGGSTSNVVSEAIFPELLNEQVGKYNQFMTGADTLVPSRILERPMRRLQVMEDLRADILTRTEEVNAKINEIYKSIHVNMFNPSTDEGVLEIDFSEYDDCYFVDTT